MPLTHLYEMKPNKKTPAHHTEKYAELVCSNSLKAMRVESAAGLLKEEMRRLDSFLMKCADACKVPAGGALAVDRDIFSSLATEGIKSCELIEVYEEEVCEIPKDEMIGKVIITKDYIEGKGSPTILMRSNG